MGRPSTYDPSYVERVRRYGLLGLTSAQMAQCFGVSDVCLDNWRAAHPDFEEAMLDAKHEADAKVAEALYRRAIGYRKKVTKVFQFNGETLEHEIEEEVEPDVQAACKWLHNRRPTLWRVSRDMDDDEQPTPVKVVLEVIDARVRAEPQSAAG